MADLSDYVKKERGMKPADKDELRNPDGIYSGPSKRVAISDGTFAPVGGVPKNSRAPIRPKG